MKHFLRDFARSHAAGKRRVRAVAALLAAALSLSLAGCGPSISVQPGDTARPASTSRPSAAPNTSSPGTPAPTQTLKPSLTPKPSATPAPTPTPTPKPTPAPTPTPTPTPSVPAGTLPDPYSFLFGDAEVTYTVTSGRYHTAKFFFDADKTNVADEYIVLLQESRFCMTLRDSYVKSSSGGTSYTYIFDYTGPADIPHFDVNNDKDMSFMIDVYVMDTLLSVEFWLAPDGFTFRDFGDRSSDKGLVAACQDRPANNQSGGPLSAEKFNGNSSGSSGGSGSGVPTSPPSQNKNRISCTKCHGTGKIACSACDGKGGRNVYINTPGYGGSGGGSSTKWENCSKCYGSGKVTCTTCGGSGYTYY